MGTLTMCHRRLYGYMCVLLLLQEFHVVIRADIQRVYGNVRDLSERFQKQDANIKTKLVDVFKGCSDARVADVNGIGLSNTPQGVIVRIMYAVLYTIGDCGSAARNLLRDVIEHTGEEEVSEFVATLTTISEDITKRNNAENLLPSDAKDIDTSTVNNDNKFLSDLLIENILNVAEMWKLFGTVANGETFENNTEVIDQVSHVGDFELDEIQQRENIWITNHINDKKSFEYTTRNTKVLMDSRNDSAAQRLVRDITVSYKLDSNTDLFVIYDQESQYALSVNDNTFSLTEYNEGALEKQLWVIKDGRVIHVASRMGLTFPYPGNASSVITLGAVQQRNHTWRLHGHYLVSHFDSRCVLNVLSNLSTLAETPVYATLDCDVDLSDVKTSIIFYPQANTSENFYRYATIPSVSSLKTMIARFTQSKFMIFVRLLRYMIMPSSSNHEHNTYLEPKRLRLDITFFIKNTLMPCQVLSGKVVNETLRLSFEDFKVNAMDSQLWYWKNGQIINVATQMPIEINAFLMNQEIIYDAAHIRLWTLNNGTLLSNTSCQLRVNEKSFEIVLDCTSQIQQWQWDFITYGKNQAYFLKVVCPFFIQSLLPPCELATVSNDNYLVSSPLKTGTAIHTQLWYQSDGNLINVYYLKMLSERGLLVSANVATHSTKWQFKNKNISNFKNANVLTLDTKRNGSIVLDQDQNQPNQQWKTVSAIEDSEYSLNCQEMAFKSRTPFVIRNNETQTCRFLTITKNNQDIDILQMKHFDVVNLDHYIWYNVEGSLIHAATGLAIQPAMKPTKGSQYNLIPAELHAFQQKQKWTLDSSKMLRWELNSECFIDFVDDSIMMNCEENRSFAPKWTFTNLPSDENGLYELMTTFVCFYFLRSTTEPCQYITADPESGRIHLRPMDHDLLENQLWYWSERRLAVSTTGQFMGVQNDSISVELVNPGANILSTDWKLRHDRLIFRATGAHMSIDYEFDGALFVSKKQNTTPLQILFVECNSKFSSCPSPLFETKKLFYIRSQHFDCLFLTGAKQGEQPKFEYFDQDDFDAQLWYIANDHIINLKSRLVLDAVLATYVSGSHVIMQNYYKYANSQMWMKSGEMIFFANSEKCVLDVGGNDEILVWCTAHGGQNQRWEFIAYDNDPEKIQNLLCPFYIRSEIIPCDFLTHTGDSNVQLRPITKEFIDHQFWYWSKNRIINYASGLALHVSDSGEVNLTKRNSTNPSKQSWINREMQIVSATNSNRVIGMDNNNVALLDIHNSGNENKYKWRFIDAENLSNDQSLQQCEKITNPVGFIIRSDKKPCNILSETRNGDIKLLKVGTDNARQVWTNIRRHIINVESGKALSVNEIKNGEPVKSIHRYEHEPNQHWVKTKSSAYIGPSGHTKLLDAYNDVCVWKEDGSDDQKWTWLNIKDVKEDSKLLRCSFCYDKGEETANEVMSYIPLFGLFYSLIRSGVYASKDCDDVALESLTDFGISIGLDLGIAVVTVLSAGTASAAALGVKTAVQSGAKLGLKMALKAMTSSMKLTLQLAVNTGKVALKQGMKKTVIQFSKQKLSNVKYSLKSGIKTLRNIPIQTKRLVVKTSAVSIKKVSSKVYNFVRSTPYGTFKGTVKGRLIKLPTELKKKLQKIGDELAETAENNIKQLEDINKSKSNHYVRCKRAPGSSCIKFKNKGSSSTEKNIVKESPFIPNPDSRITGSFQKLLNKAKKDVKIEKLQNAHFGLSSRKLHSGVDYKFDENTVRSRVLNQVDEYPYDKNYQMIKYSDEKGKKLQSHTEQALLNDMDEAIRKNCAGKNCELFMWTKNSPCMENTHRIKERTIPAKSCFSMLLEFCNNHVKNTPGFTGCHVGFSDFYTKDRKYAEKKFFKELSDMTETTKNLNTKSNRYPTLTKENLSNTKSFIKFYRIPKD